MSSDAELLANIYSRAYSRIKINIPAHLLKFISLKKFIDLLRVKKVRPSRIPGWISKIDLALGSYEFLAMLEGKTIKGLFF